MSGPPAGPARYPIRAVSRLTGIGIDTLRAWERRYGAVTPTRDDRGRMYTEADVARLRLLNGAVEQGHSIGRLAGLSNDQLRDLCGAAGAVALPRPFGHGRHRSIRAHSSPRCASTTPSASTRSFPGWPRFCVRSTSCRTC